MTTKDKVIARLKNQNVELTTKIVKIKGDHYATLQEAKSKSIAMNGKIDKLKAQVKTRRDKKITELEAKIALKKWSMII